MIQICKSRTGICTGLAVKFRYVVLQGLDLYMQPFADNGLLILGTYQFAQHLRFTPGQAVVFPYTLQCLFRAEDP